MSCGGGMALHLPFSRSPEGKALVADPSSMWVRALYQLELFNDGEGCLPKPQAPDPGRNGVSLSVCERVSCRLCPTPWTPWTVAPQTFLSVEFSRQEYWSGLPFPSPEPELRDILTKNLKCRKDGSFLTSLFHFTFWENIPLFFFFRFKRGQLNTCPFALMGMERVMTASQGRMAQLVLSSGSCQVVSIQSAFTTADTRATALEWPRGSPTPAWQ